MSKNNYGNGRWFSTIVKIFVCVIGFIILTSTCETALRDFLDLYREEDEHPNYDEGSLNIISSSENKVLDENIYYPLEGYLFADTYSFKKKSTVEEVVTIMFSIAQLG